MKHYQNLWLALLALALLSPISGAREVPFDAAIVDSNITAVRGLDAADVDGDGDLDVLVAATGTVEILWVENNNGDGSSWTTHNVDSTFPIAKSVAGGDIDGDGDIDIVASSNSSADITWWENTAGDGSTWTRHDIATSYGDAEAVSLADIDGDGHLDVLAVGGSKVTWFENQGGDGLTWVEDSIDTLFSGALDIHGCDLDGDGDTDVIATGELIDSVAWWENTSGDGSTWTEQTIDAGFNGGASVFAADMDGDGDVDVLAAAEDDNELTWYENGGPASLGFDLFGTGLIWTPHVIDSDFLGAISIFAGDVDDDGDMDVVAAARGGNDISWYENTAGDGSTWTERLIFGSFSSTRFAAAADFNKDGNLDIYGSALNISEVSWWQNVTIHRSGHYPVEDLLQGDFNGARAIATGDLDGDGDQDVAAAAPDDSELAWWENTAGDASTFSKSTLPAAYAAQALEVLDIDRDGDQDLLASSEGGDDISWFSNDGSGTFTQSSIATLTDVRQAAAADVDGDGDPDVLSASATDTEIAWYANDGSGGTWTKTVIDSSYSNAASVFGGDIDGDGDIDAIAMAGAPSNLVTWWENTSGTGLSWSAGNTIDPSYSAATFVSAADVDCDGDLDVLGTGGGSPGLLTWWDNAAGDGTVWTQRDISCPACSDALHEPLFAHGQDLDDDGDTDVLATGSASGGQFHWYENAGDGLTWTLHTVSSAIDGAAGAAATDMDADGDIDILSTAQVDDDLSYWDNRGGQFALPTTDLGASLGNSVTAALLRVAAIHRGRAGDPNAELTSFEFLFELTAGVPLSTAETNSIIENLFIYLDDGDLSFDMGSDTLVTTLGVFSLVDGVQIVPLVKDDPNVQLTHGTTRNYFAVLETTATYTAGPVAALLFSHVTEASSTADDTDDDIPLLLEFEANVATGPITVNPSGTQADLSVTISDSADPVTSGDSYSYTISVTNNGPASAENVVLSTTLSGPASFSTTSGGCSEDPAGVPVCNLGTLAASTSVDVTVNMTTSAAMGGMATADVTVSTTTADLNPGNNTASEDTTVSSLSTDVVLEKFVTPFHFVSGMTVSYRIEVSNTGSLAANGTSVSDTFPGAVTGITWTCTGSGGATCNNANGSGNLAAELVDLPAGGSVLFEATGTATGTLDFTNTATATVPGGLTDPDLSNNTDDARSIAVMELSFFGDFEEGDCSEWNVVFGGGGACI